MRCALMETKQPKTRSLQTRGLGTDSTPSPRLSGLLLADDSIWGASLATSQSSLDWVQHCSGAPKLLQRGETGLDSPCKCSPFFLSFFFVVEYSCEFVCVCTQTHTYTGQGPTSGVFSIISSCVLRQVLSLTLELASWLERLAVSKP